MLLSHLYPNETFAVDPDITMLGADSRRVGAGTLFFAVNGTKESGIKFIPDAVARGAVAIVVPNNCQEIKAPEGIPVILVDNPRAEIARCASIMYPAQPENIIAVTGTSGKTSTTYFIQQLCNLLGKPAVSIGTLGLAGKINQYGSLTTPEAPELHTILSRLALDGINHVAMEASSQALHQHRMDQVKIKAAGFTNISRDHLDYHGTMEAYLSAKKILFTRILSDNGVAVLNADDDAYPQIYSECKERGISVISFGFAENSDLQLKAQNLTLSGQDLEIVIQGKTYALTVDVAGAFQAHNILCAIGLMQASGFGTADILTAAKLLKAPPGRLEPVIGHPKNAAIYVDYAHKPDALLAVLKGLRAHNPKRLICLFGCGGDRDAGKRPIMGQIASQYSDVVIVTDDNPRSEEPAMIRAAICSAAPTALNIPDRRNAIRQAIAMIDDGDILVIAGKGHETGQIFATHTDPFSDVDEVRHAISLLTIPRHA